MIPYLYFEAWCPILKSQTEKWLTFVHFINNWACMLLDGFLYSLKSGRCMEEWRLKEGGQEDTQKSWKSHKSHKNACICINYIEIGHKRELALGDTSRELGWRGGEEGFCGGGERQWSNPFSPNGSDKSAPKSKIDLRLLLGKSLSHTPTPFLFPQTLVHVWNQTISSRASSASPSSIFPKPFSIQNYSIHPTGLWEKLFKIRSGKD